MDQTRYFVAIGLTFIVLMGWQYFFVAPYQEPIPNQEKSDGVETQSEQSKTTSDSADTNSIKTSEAKALDIVKTNQTDTVAEKIDIETNLFKAVISEKNAAVTNFILKEYKETSEDNSPLKSIINEKTPGFLSVSFLNQSVPDITNAVYTTDIKKLNISSNAEESIEKSVSFQWSSETGVDIIKTYEFNPDTYLFDMKLTVNNRSDKPLNDEIAVSLYERVEKNDNRYGFIGPSTYVNDSLEQIKMDDIEDDVVFTGEISWSGVQDIYFINALIPESKNDGKIVISRENGFVNSKYVKKLSVAPQTRETFTLDLYFGPKNSEILAQNGHNLDKSLNFGWFDFIAKPCLWFMNFIYSFIPNYGIAIIILTLIIKLVLWPLGTKSYKSMGQMKKIQPLMAEIREKYKDDKKRMNEEMMNLYKTYKVNPVGGCLPMFLQIPVFFALYRMLYESIELRHAPFFGWINDLSAPDRLFHFDFSIPFMHEPYGIPVLTLIMGATMLLQQKMSPPPGDPSQAKMMMFMPVAFTFIFINFPSGLVLYWLINNIVSIGQQYYITKKTT